MGKHRGRKKIPTVYEKGIAIRELRTDYFVVDFQVKNRRVRKCFSDLDKAKVYCQQKRIEITSKGTDALVFTDKMRHDALEAWKLLKDTGVSLLDVAKDYVRRHPTTLGETVEETCKRYLDNMVANGRRKLSIIDKRLKFDVLCKDLGTLQTASLEKTDIQKWASQFASPKAEKHVGAACSLMAFFNGELKQRRNSDEKPPATWCTRLVAVLFKKAQRKYPEAVPALTVLFFAGLRPNEMLRLAWEQIDLDGKVIRLTGEQTKTRTMRNVAISDNAHLWLKAYQGKGLVVESEGHFRKLRRNLMRSCKVKEWPVDVPRHTFATMHYNAHKNAAETMAQLGHFGNSQMFVTHYKGVPVTAEDVAAYWKISPKTKEDIKAKGDGTGTQPKLLKVVQTNARQEPESATSALTGKKRSRLK